MLTEQEMADIMRPFIAEAVVTGINHVLEMAALSVENLSLYDDFDERTRDAAAELVRAHKLKKD
jgi:hypothetical protein